MKRSHAVSNVVTIAGAIILGLGLTTLILLAVGAPPLDAFANLLRGAFGQLIGPDGGLNLLNSRTGATLTFWIPLLLCSTGLLLTFTGGLWNIGVEGQMTLGAIAASFIALQVGTIVFPTDLGVIVTLRQARAITSVEASPQPARRRGGRVAPVRGQPARQRGGCRLRRAGCGDGGSA
ncbi:MAG: hypothetical protein M5R40_08560 [Anaerolineae bacterium]|nr:hypothetical protein [Anaerolineae bacterium]